MRLLLWKLLLLWMRILGRRLQVRRRRRWYRCVVLPLRRL